MSYRVLVRTVFDLTSLTSIAERKDGGKTLPLLPPLLTVWRKDGGKIENMVSLKYRPQRVYQGRGGVAKGLTGGDFRVEAC